MLIKSNVDLLPRHKTLLHYLKSHRNPKHDASIFIKKKTISADLNISLSSVGRHIKQLEDMGYLEVEDQMFVIQGKNRRINNRYYFTNLLLNPNDSALKETITKKLKRRSRVKKGEPCIEPTILTRFVPISATFDTSKLLNTGTGSLRKKSIRNIYTLTELSKNGCPFEPQFNHCDFESGGRDEKFTWITVQKGNEAKVKERKEPPARPELLVLTPRVSQALEEFRNDQENWILRDTTTGKNRLKVAPWIKDKTERLIRMAQHRLESSFDIESTVDSLTLNPELGRLYSGIFNGYEKLREGLFKMARESDARRNDDYEFKPFIERNPYNIPQNKNRIEGEDDEFDFILSDKTQSRFLKRAMPVIESEEDFDYILGIASN
jgi:hypothetical protein